MRSLFQSPISSSQTARKRSLECWTAAKHRLRRWTSVRSHRALIWPNFSITSATPKYSTEYNYHQLICNQPRNPTSRGRQLPLAVQSEVPPTRTSSRTAPLRDWPPSSSRKAAILITAPTRLSENRMLPSVALLHRTQRAALARFELNLPL